jgi:PAS domain S-box-containing protein
LFPDGDGLDFDMLAEYLLDEGTFTEGDVLGLSAFDFNLDSTNQSGIVSPEQSDAGGTPDFGSMDAPKPNSTVMQVQNIITAHAAAAQQGKTPIAPAPSSLGPQGGMPMAPAPAIPPYAAIHAPIAAAPAVVLHHHGAAAAAGAGAGGTKRRRMDQQQPMMAVTSRGPYMAPPMPTAGRGRQKSQAQVERRRERNRILARRTRLRKKFFFESLQKDVMDLQRENVALKEIVKVKLDAAAAKKLLAECDAMEKLPESVLEACGELATDIDQQDQNLVKSIQTSQQSFIITDPSLHDNPIVYASEGFLALTGYAKEEVLGRNCRFLQGTETLPSKVEQIRKAVSNGEDCSVTMINYTSDGTAFWNKLFIAPLRDAQNNIVNFIGVVVKVAAPEPGDVEAGKLLPGQKEETVDEMKSDDVEQTVQAIGGAMSKAVANASAARVPGPFFS